MSTSLREHLEARADGGGLVRDMTVRSAALGGAALFGLRADTLNLPDADLRDAAFEGARLTDCGFTGAQVDETTFDRAQLWQCDLRRCQGRRARFRHARIGAGFFQGAVLPAADFEEAVIEDVRFDGADLSHARFTGAALDSVRFTDAELGGADFRGARLTRVDFSGARLAGALFDAGVDPRMLTAADPVTDPRPPDPTADVSSGAASVNLARALTTLIATALAPEDRAVVADGLTALLAAAPAPERAQLARLLDERTSDAEPWSAELEALVAEIRTMPGDRPQQLAQAVPALLRRLAVHEAPADQLSTRLPAPSGRGPETDEARGRRLRDEAAEAIAAAMRSRGLDPE